MSLEDYQTLSLRCTEAERKFLKVKTLHEENAKRLEAAKEECRILGYDPDNLDAEIEAVRERANEMSTKLDKTLTELENELEKYE
jgi:hypothetical protein